MGAYGAFAEVYDLLMDDFDYPAWAQYYLKLLETAGVRPKTMAECACGTGSMTIPFAEAGIRVTGVDLSGEMLEIAAEKARRAGVRPMFVRQDMAKLTLPRPADALVCACDGVNYLLSDEQVDGFFRAAHRAIRPGGALAFDVSSEYKLEKVLGNGFFGEERDEVAYLWANAYDPQTRIVQMDLTFFCREESGLYRRFAETHRQRAHRPEELTARLREAGFGQIKVFGDRTFEPPKPDEMRIHFLAVRE